MRASVVSPLSHTGASHRVIEIPDKRAVPNGLVSMTSAETHGSDAGGRRLALARRIAPGYAALPRIAAVLVGGSVARGYADRWSDLALGVVWTSPPTDGERQAAANAVAATQRRVFPDPGPTGALEEEYLVAELKVDVGHLTLAAVEQILRGVTVDGAPDFAKQTLVSVLRTAVPLHGDQVLAGWRRRAASYPDALMRAMVTRHLVFGPHWYLTMLAERDDLLLLTDLLCRVARAILGVLLGLNRVYPPSTDFKWALRIAAELSIAPADLPVRLERVFRAEPVAGVHEAQCLIDETITLVESHYPSFDTTAVRARVAQRRLSA